MQTRQFRVELMPHPGSLALEVRQITVEGEQRSETLALCYTLEGDWAGFSFPDRDHPAPPDRLWTHSCCEFFWREAAATAYTEYNFSPSWQWAAYAFSAYRKRQENITPPVPQNMNWGRSSSTLVLRVEVPIPACSLQLAFAVVLQRRSGEIVYYALRHPPGSPDFHHSDNFALSFP